MKKSYLFLAFYLVVLLNTFSVNAAVRTDLNNTYANTDSTEQPSSPQSEDNFPPTQAPEIKTFGLNPDIMGAIQNSINLFTGQVNLPINLISMNNGSGLAANVSILYSSAGVSKQAKTWNREAPTGVLGLGWNFSYSQIVRDHKGTGAREDDDFYLVDGGSSNQLICVAINDCGINTEIREYKTKSYQPWIIKWYSSADYWIIIKEDGTQYFYGGDKQNEIGNVNSQQYCVRWGNWIGNSYETQGNPTPMPIVWNCSSIRNQWGNKISFTYSNVERNLPARQTEASYLETITDDFGHKIKIFYGEKDPLEYSEPHAEEGEPDGYQERYEKKYMDSIALTQNDNLVTSIKFNYTFLDYFQNSEEITKRLLQSIVQSNENKEALQPLKFEYYPSGNDNFGLLKKVKSPLGAEATYNYSSIDIGNSQRDLIVQSPEIGYTQPRVFIAEDYVVITWRKNSGTSYEPIYVEVYDWLGAWHKSMSIKLDDEVQIPIVDDDGLQSFDISLQKDFFAFLAYTNLNESESRLLIFSRNESIRGDWTYDKFNVPYHTTKSHVQTGNNFVIVDYDVSSGILGGYHTTANSYKQIYNKKINPTNNTPIWFLASFPDSESESATDRTIPWQIRATNNYYFLSDITAHKVTLTYFDELMNWHHNTLTNGKISSSRWDYRLYLSNSFAFCLPEGGPEQIYKWDTKYNIEMKEVEALYDESDIYSINNTIFAASNRLENTNKNGWYYYRYTGNDWKTYGQCEQYMLEPGSFGDDLIIWKNADTPNFMMKTYFDVKNMKWSEDFLHVTNNTSTGTYYRPHISNEYLTLDNMVFKKHPNSFDYNYSFRIQNQGISYGPMFNGFNFSFFEDNSGVNFIHYKNGYSQPNEYGQLLSEAPTEHMYGASSNFSKPYDGSNLSGGATQVTFSSQRYYFNNNTSLHLYRVVGDNCKGLQNAVCVASIDIMDGKTTTTTSYEYTGSSATIDKTGNIPQFNEVKVIPGNYTSLQKPFGFTSHYFFNEIRASEEFTEYYNETGQNSGWNYMYLTGLPYKTVVYNQTGAVICTTRSYWNVNKISINDDKSYCWYARQVKSIQLSDGIRTVSESSYNNEGFLKSQKTYNTTLVGQEEVLVMEYKYGYEVPLYFDSRIKEKLVAYNILTPIVQTTKKNGSTVIQSSVSTLKYCIPSEEIVRIVPDKSYILTAQPNNGYTDFNFASWTGADEYTQPSSEWLLISSITAIDDKGHVLESKNIDGLSAGICGYDGNNFPIAKFSNTSANLVFAENFDDLSLNNAPTNWTISPTESWSITSQGTLHGESSSGNAIIYPASTCSAMAGSFISELSFRIESSPNTLAHAAEFQFCKTNAGDGWNNSSASGYSLKFSKNGLIELYDNANVQLASYSAAINTSDWQRVRVVAENTLIKIYLNGIKVLETSNKYYTGQYISFSVNSSSAEFDNILVYPAEAYTSMYSYSPLSGSVKEVFNSDGTSIKFVYDAFHRKIAAIGPDNVPNAIINSSLSYDRNDGVYNSDDPNTTTSTSVEGSYGEYIDFSTNLNKWTSSNGTDIGTLWYIEKGKLINNGLSQTTLSYDLGQNISGRVAIEMSVKNDNGTTGFGISAGGANINSVSTYFQSCSTWVTGNYTSPNTIASWLAPKKTYRLKLVLDYNSKTADYFVDGKPCLHNEPFIDESSSSLCKITLFNHDQSSNNYWTIDDILIYSEPAHSIVFSDGGGKKLQSQSEESGDFTLVNQTLYDEINRPFIQTLTKRIPGWLGYRNDFATGINADGTIIGKIKYYHQDEFPYSRTVYEASPLSRPIEQGAPGAECIIGKGNSSKIAYSHSTDFNLKTFTNPDGKISKEYMDKLGRVVSKSASAVKMSGITTTEISISPAINCTTATQNFTATVSGEVSYCYAYNGHAGNTLLITQSSNIVVDDTSSSNGEHNGTYIIEKGKTYVITVKGLSNDRPPSFVTLKIPTWNIAIDIEPKTTFEYDVFGNLITIYPPNYFNQPVPDADVNKYPIRMTYNFLGRMLSKSTPDAGVEKYLYDNAGRLRFMLDANGGQASPNNVLYKKYDVLGRIVEEGYFQCNWSNLTAANAEDKNFPTYSDTWRKRYTYSGNINNTWTRGKLVSIEVNNGNIGTTDITELYAYSINGEIASIQTIKNEVLPSGSANSGSSSLQNNFNETISYQYTNSGHTKSIAYGSTGLSVLYSYDRLGRVSRIGTSANPSQFAAYSYTDNNGAMNIESLNNGSISQSYSYNNHGWLTSILGEYFRENIYYHYNGYGGDGYYDGKIAAIRYSNGCTPLYTVRYRYDNLGRLTTAVHEDKTLRGYGSYNIGVNNGTNPLFDPNGNMLRMNEGSTSKQYTYYPGTNRIMNTNASANQEFVYDAAGNVTASQAKGININYDPYFNLASTITHTNSSLQPVSYLYGPTNERVEKYAGTTSTFYFRGSNSYPLIETTKSGSQIYKKVYVYGPGGLIAFSNVSNGFNWNYPLKDHLGSTRRIVNQNNTAVAEYQYSPYGRIMYAQVNQDVNYKFTGQELDNEDNLHNFRARLFDPESGIFYATDPAGQMFATYGYCGNNPVSNTDPTGQIFGLDDIVVLYIASAIIAGAANTYAHRDEIHSFWQGLGYFGIGAAAGTAAVYTGGLAYGAVTGGATAAGSGGFLAGAAAGGAGAFTTTLFEGLGNTAFFGDPFPTTNQFLTSVSIGALVGGTINGAVSASNGNSFWDGKAPALSSNELPSGLSELDPNTKVHVTNKNGYNSIITDNKLDPNQSGYVTKLGRISNIDEPSKFNTLLYKRNLWKITNGRFDEGAYVFKIIGNEQPIFRGITNLRYFLPQWQYTGDIKIPVEFLYKIPPR